MSINTGTAGVFTSVDLAAALADGHITASGPLGERQIQPASLDLSLGRRAWRIRAAFLPGKNMTVQGRLESGLAMHELDLSAGAVLETGCVYLVELRERLNLPSDVRARANPKSSTGRIDVFVRLVTEHGTAYEEVPAGYCGPLFAEISPRTFSILVREGSTLNQLRLRRASSRLSDVELTARHTQSALVNDDVADIRNGLCLSVDLSDSFGGIVGYRARRHAGVVDVDRVGALELTEFWEPLAVPKMGAIILDPDEFYILASREELRIPDDLAAEMLPIDTDLGAFRVHYAGFFDPGFGTDHGSRAVLEVRGYDAPFMIEHGQTMARLIFESLVQPPPQAYGAALNSNYAGQGLRLSKHFRAT